MMIISQTGFFQEVKQSCQKKSAPLNLWDDETDPETGNFRYLANYDPAREMYVQMPENEDIQTESAVESQA